MHAAGACDDNDAGLGGSDRRVRPTHGRASHTTHGADLPACSTEEVAAADERANLAVRVLVGRVAAILARGIGLTSSRAGLGRLRAGGGRRGQDGTHATQEVAVADEGAGLAAGILVGRVAAVIACGVGLAGRRTGRAGRGVGSQREGEAT